VLVWASAVIPAKPYYRIILDQINAHGAVVNGLWRRASKRTPVHVIDSLATDLKTWIMLLERLNGAPIEVGLRRLSSPFHCFSDASKHGIGWHIEGVGLFDAHPFPASWLELHIMKESKYQTLFIGVLEAYACLHMLRRAIPTVGVNLQLPVHVDNLGLYYNLGGGRRQGAISSRCPLMQPVLMEITWLCQVYNCTLCPYWVRSATNEFADLLSRGFKDGKPLPCKRLSELMVEANGMATASAKRGLLQTRHPARPDLLPLLEAARVRALDFNAPWASQSTAPWDRVLAVWDALPAPTLPG